MQQVGVRALALVAAAFVVLMWPSHAVAAHAADPASTDKFTIHDSPVDSTEDQLATAVGVAAAHGRVLQVGPGTVTLTRTFWLPVGATLSLSSRTVLTGVLPGQSLVRMQSGARLVGGVIWNRSAVDCLDVDVAGRSQGAAITNVTFKGSKSNAVLVNAPDVSSLSVQNNHFVDNVYGVLVNPGALRSKNLLISGNHFAGVTGDAIEINAAISRIPDRVRNVNILGNIIVQMRGSGGSSGFAIGMAGVQTFRVTANRITGARNEAIHLEDGSRDGLVSQNLVEGGGSGGRPAIAVYRGVDSVRVQENVVVGFYGSGIAVLWDARGSSRNITIEQNVVRGVSGEGIIMGGNVGTGPFIARNNAVVGAQVGFVSLGTHQRDLVVGNLIRGSRGPAIRSAYAGTSTRTVSANRTDGSTRVASIVGARTANLLKLTTAATPGLRREG